MIIFFKKYKIQYVCSLFIHIDCIHVYAILQQQQQQQHCVGVPDFYLLLETLCECKRIIITQNNKISKYLK